VQPAQSRPVLRETAGMRILHITDTMEYASGVSRYIREVTDLFRSKGHVADVWSPPGIGDDVGSLFTRLLGFRYCNDLQRVLREGRYDVLHAHNVLMRLSPLPLREAGMFRIPVALTVHDFNLVCPRKWMITDRNEPCESAFGIACLVRNCRSGRPARVWMPYHNLRWLKTALHRCLLRRYVNVFICPSRVLRDGVQRSLGGVYTAHVPNSVRLLPRPLARPPGARLVYAGRLSVEKGVDVLLRAMPSIVQKHPRVELMIVGDGPARKELESLSLGLQIKDRVHFTGSSEADAVIQTLQGADLAVLPSLWFENGPMVALEALAAGTPLIAARAGGLPELIRDGQEGYLFERGDVQGLADRILLALGDRRWLAEARVQARRAAETEFSPERHYERLMACYASINNPRRGRS
jgi:glycosyltransferase involved in cell wall biosynthesis